MNDRYTKGCLTVIAVLLAAIVLRGYPPVAPPVKTAPQKAEVLKVVICDKATKELGGTHILCGRDYLIRAQLLVSNDGSFAQ